MSKGSILKKNLLRLILTATIIGCSIIPNDKNTQQERAAENPRLSIKKDINLGNTNKTSWKDIVEYDAFVRSTVDNHYASDINEIYDFYNIKRDLPKYGFKSKKNGFVCFDCEGAIYKEGVDSVYFYSSCSEEMFNKYIEYFEKNRDNLKGDLTNRIHHYIKHEAAHAFYYELGKKLGEKYSSKARQSAPSILDDIQHTLVEEGVADYISYKGKLTESAKMLSDEDFKEMIEKEDDFYIYQLGFILVKPILDLNFEKGIVELIKNPLTKEDLNDLPGYRKKRIENMLREL